ncbi:MAG: LruC domain-containing protein [Pseudobdellovibrio sp.]
MNPSVKWGLSLIIFCLAIVAGFQNCSPTTFKDVSGVNTFSQQIPLSIIPKNCELEKRKDGETWMSAAGQRRDLALCVVGTGNQFKVYDIEKEYLCTDGVAVLTGKENANQVGIEGLCNLDCGIHKNGELWFNDMGISTEAMQCATSTTVTSAVKYQNSAEYKCANSIASATGITKKIKLSETACPPLTFNDQDNQATLAFEDIYPTPLDSDYNDFVTNIKVIETYSNLGELTKIAIEYAAKNIGGGLPHKFISIFDGTVRGRDNWVSNQNLFKSEPMFNGNALIKYELYDGSGALLRSNANVLKDQDLVVFESTSAAVTNLMVAKITITNIDGKQNLLSVRKGLSIKRYRSLLYIPDSGTYSLIKRYDIDISDINAASYDSVGKPLAFFVPINWRCPKSKMDIKNAYPDFSAHADYLKNSIANPSLVESDAAKNWFKNVVLINVD